MLRLQQEGPRFFEDIAGQDVSSGLAAAFRTRPEEAQEQIEPSTEIKVKRIKCLAMEGLVEEGQEPIATSHPTNARSQRAARRSVAAAPS